jgi:hypothetical protein
MISIIYGILADCHLRPCARSCAGIPRRRAHAKQRPGWLDEGFPLIEGDDDR